MSSSRTEILEFEELKKSFLLSLVARQQLLQSLINEITPSADQKKTPEKKEKYLKVCRGIQFVVHKLAGVAEPYGFPDLSLICGELDDWLQICADPNPLELLKRTKKIEMALSEINSKSDLQNT